MPSALEACAEHGLEGIVTKRLDSPYRPGERSCHWLKTPYRATAELLVAGYWCASGPGGRAGVGSLLVAGYDAAGDLVACGQVGTGFSDSIRRHLYAQLHPTRRTTAPVANVIEAPGVRFVEPLLVVEVAYREYVQGRWLRHASFKGLRDTQRDAVVEQAQQEASAARMEAAAAVAAQQGSDADAARERDYAAQLRHELDAARREFDDARQRLQAEIDAAHQATQQAIAEAAAVRVELATSRAEADSARRAAEHDRAGRVTTFSRNGLDVSSCFPELSQAAAAVGDRPMVLDGEIVAVDARR